jgi:predicted porin
VALFPVTGLTLGGSFARGEWLDREVMDLLPTDTEGFSQTAFGADVEYSRDYWLIRSELVWSRWELPFAATATSANLDSLAVWIEARYRLTPRVFVAGRFDRLTFSRIADGSSPPIRWEAPVTRVEGDIGYYLQRNLIVRAAVQHNDREGGRIPRRTYFSGQIAYWF